MSSKSRPILLVIFGIVLTFLIATGVTYCSLQDMKKGHAAPDYSDRGSWAYFAEGSGKDADLFLICPTVDVRPEYNMSLSDKDTMNKFLGALNMERGIYEDVTRMYAPYYRQAAMQVYSLDEASREPYLEIAYSDISAAFKWYLENENNGRPIILAGFSQGADMCYRLMKEYFSDSNLQEKLICVYAIGWQVTDAEMQAYPQIVAAKGETDTGVVISFDCESEYVTRTFICPEGRHGACINPLNWRTDSEPASREMNPGACFTDYSGSITKEIEGLCGCYIDMTRGVLKVTDINASDYKNPVPGLPDEAFHVYDYQFFFRALQQNVALRTECYFEIIGEKAS